VATTLSAGWWGTSGGTVPVAGVSDGRKVRNGGEARWEW
jgi:hypothetical protein